MMSSSQSELRAEVAPSQMHAAPERSAASGQLIGIQVLRGIAALAVVFHHTLEEAASLFTPESAWYALARTGACGVDLFFVISGFIMLHTNWRRIGQPDATREFLSRRILRIYPFYWLCLCVVMAGYTAGLYRSLLLSPDAIASSLLLYPSNSRLLMPVAWTLVFEIYFYVLFALWIRARSASVLLLGMAGTFLAIGASAQLLPESAVRDFFSNRIIIEFLFGVALACLFRAGKRPASPALLSLLAVSMFVGASYWNPGQPVDVTGGLNEQARFYAWGLPAALMTFGWLAPFGGQGRVWRWLETLGNASYALYLTHTFVMISFARLLKSERAAHALPPWAWVSLALVSSLLLGWLAHTCAEEPLNRKLRQLQSRLRGEPLAVAKPEGA